MSKNNLEGSVKNHPLCVSSSNRWVKGCCTSVSNNCKKNCGYNKLLCYNNSIKQNTFTYFDIQPDTIFRNINVYNKTNKLHQKKNYYKLF